MESRTKTIRCLGGITLDRKLKPKQPLTLSTSNPVSSISSLGGVAHNIARNLAQLTNNIYLQSAVGNDSEGMHAIEQIKKMGINVDDVLIFNQQSTARYDAILNEKGELYLALADMEIFDHIPFEMFTQSWEQWQAEDIIFLDTNLPEAILESAIEVAQEKQCTLCIDPVSVSKAKKLPQALNHVFLIKPDRYEIEALTDIKIDSAADCVKAGKILLSRGVENCVITLGHLGFVIVNSSIQKHFPALSVEGLVDVSGAGDAFFAGILYGLQQGFNLVESCQLGAGAATMTLQSYQSVNTTLTTTSLKKMQEKYKESSDANIF